MSRRLKQVVDLYTAGRTVRLRDGSLVWVQALNPFEHDTARSEAQVARSRLTLAIREIGSDEQNKVRMFFLEGGLADARDKLVDAQVTIATPRIVEKFRDDPDWTEKLQILDRGDQNTATALEPAETELLSKLEAEFAIEFSRRVGEERSFQETKYESASEDELWAEYLQWYLDRRGSEVMLAEFRMYQALYGARWCEGTDHGDGGITHENCNGHDARVFANQSEVRSAPAEFMDALLDALDELEFSIRDAKNSDRQSSSSDSSRLPSAEGESTPSTQDETPVAPPGISPSLSPTPSPSSASES